jgi:outer membrane protein OmpA-like peptidoglycan-associated protein
VIFGISVLFARDLSPRQSRTGCSLVTSVLQVEFPTKRNPRVAPSGFLRSQPEQTSGLDQSKASASVAQAAFVATQNPPFLRRPILFGPNSVELTVVGRNTLQRAATWLRQHYEARILIVGSCDVSGSETCTHVLAEARGAVLQKFLGSSGIDAGQIVGVKGWDNVDQSCQTSDFGCWQFNRTARIFMASSVAP